MPSDRECLEAMIDCIEKLNEYLKNDVNYYKNNNHVSIERSNIEKLELNSQIDSLREKIIQRQDAFRIYTDLWKTLILKIKINSDLLIINNKIVQNNLKYYDQLKMQLINNTNFSKTYNKLALTE